MTMNPQVTQALKVLSQPSVNLPASALMHSGLSAYGNALNQNELEKADGRLILEAVMAGLGALGGGLAYRRLGKMGTQKIHELPYAKKKQIAQVLTDYPILERLRRTAPAYGGLAAGGTGAALAGTTLAPLIAGNLHLLGAPSMSGRQHDYYEEDQPV
tara:strand:- start:83 stop:556 length:474 start_codon:yes stop_codon:yes gene_type:complete